MTNRHLIPMIALCVISLGCAGEPESSEQASGPERTYELRGQIVDRDPMANTVKVDHEAIGDWMGAMTMTFPVRGEDVQNLPDNGVAVTGTVHVAGTDYWLSDVTIAEEGSAAQDEGAAETVEEGGPDTQ